MDERPYSRQALIAQGPRSEASFLFFYGHDAALGPQAVLSNFWHCPQPFADSENRQFSTSEHYMMHGKAVLFGDEEMAEAILNAPTPLAAKKLGRKVRNFDNEVWRQHRLRIVAEGCFLKFSQCKNARRFLLGTGDRILVEAAARDRIWGIGMSAANVYKCDPTKWRGLNLLGETLMMVRHRLRENGSADETKWSLPALQNAPSGSVANN
ncbi:YbiA-like protein [Gracilaria domingensis]|nr:YbiA-like protein [Gracilaria domingensis]